MERRPAFHQSSGSTPTYSSDNGRKNGLGSTPDGSQHLISRTLCALNVVVPFMYAPHDVTDREGGGPKLGVSEGAKT